MIQLKMFGTKGQTRWMALDVEDRNDFERGQTDVFKVTSDNVGRIFRIELRINGSRDAWFGSKVSGRVYMYTDRIRSTLYYIIVYLCMSVCLTIDFHQYLRIDHIISRPCEFRPHFTFNC